MLNSETDTDRIELLEQLPLQSDVDDLNFSIPYAPSDNDDDNSDDSIISNMQKISKPLNLINDSDDTDDTDLDIQKPLNTDRSELRSWYYKPSNWIKLNIIFFLISLLISALLQPQMIWNLFQIFLSWMSHNMYIGSLALVGIYIICDLLMLPCLIFTLGAGFVYCNVLNNMWSGLIISTLLVFISEFIGSTIAFLSARYLLRKSIKKIAIKYPKFGLIDAAVKKHGFKVTLLFRMSPVTPYNLFNYFMGLTSVRLMDYLMASVGILPNFFICAAIGGSIHHIYQLSNVKIQNNIPLLVFTLCGIVFIICAIIYGTKLIKRELTKISIQLKQEKDILSSEDRPLTNMDMDIVHGVSDYDIPSIDLISNDNISAPDPYL